MNNVLTISTVIFVTALSACADHRTAVCVEGRDETVCFDDAELATVVALDECVDSVAIATETRDDLVIACGARAVDECGPCDQAELWRKLVVVYTHAPRVPSIDDDLNSALHYVCTRAHGSHCEQYTEP